MIKSNLSKSLADELNQPTSFPTARSNKKSEKHSQVQNPIKPKNSVVWACLKKLEFSEPGCLLVLF